jgi:hypothetical protein
MRTIATPEGARETFTVRVQKQRDGYVLATCSAPLCMVRDTSEEAALRRIRDEIRYRIELCPCTGVGEEYVQLHIERA